MEGYELQTKTILNIPFFGLESETPLHIGS